MYHLTILEARILRLRYQKGHDPEGTGEEHVQGLTLRFWWFLGSWQQNSNPYMVFSLCVSVYPNFSFL